MREYLKDTGVSPQFDRLAVSGGFKSCLSISEFTHLRLFFCVLYARFLLKSRSKTTTAACVAFPAPSNLSLNFAMH